MIPVRVVLVEDHAMFREMFAFVLEREPGFEVVAQAGSLSEAREKIEDLGEGGVDVAVVDLHLPDGNGTELIAEFCGQDASCAALVLTASLDLAVYGRAVGAGAAGVLHKSAGMKEVADAVGRLAAGEALLSQGEAVKLLRLADRERTQGRETRSAFEQLTPREKDALQALAEGMGDREIADVMGVGLGTARGYVAGMLRKLGARSRLQALVFAVRHGFVRIEPAQAPPE